MAVIRKKNSKWFVDFYVGSTRKRLTFNNKYEAEGFKRALLLRPLDLASGFVEVKRVTIAEAAKQYIDLVSSKKAPETLILEKRYFSIMEEYFGECLVSDISLISLEGFQLHLLKRGLSAASVNRYFNTFNNFFRKCQDWKFTAENSALKLGRLKEEKRVIKTWATEDIQKVIDVVEPWMAEVIYFIAKTGVRRGEARLLKWGDVDMAKRLIHVKSYKGGECQIRDIPMTEELFEFLKFKVCIARSKFVFVNAEGEAISQTALSTQMHRAAKKASLPGMKLHGLRHSILTSMANSDVSLRKIQSLAGHGSLKTTEKYLHLGTEELRKSLTQMESTDSLRHCWAPKAKTSEGEVSK